VSVVEIEMLPAWVLDVEVGKEQGQVAEVGMGVPSSVKA